MVAGRLLPTEKDPNPQIYRMRVFAGDEVLARSKFFYHMKALRRVKRANGEVLSVNEIFERKTNSVKNYGIVMRYKSRTGVHNMYKEYRDITLNGAVSQMYMEMAGRHKAVQKNIQIIKTVTVGNHELRRQKYIVFASNKARFPNLKGVYRAASKDARLTFTANRPNVTML